MWQILGYWHDGSMYSLGNKWPCAGIFSDNKPDDLDLTTTFFCTFLCFTILSHKLAKKFKAQKFSIGKRNISFATPFRKPSKFQHCHTHKACTKKGIAKSVLVPLSVSFAKKIHAKFIVVYVCSVKYSYFIPRNLDSIVFCLLKIKHIKSPKKICIEYVYSPNSFVNLDEGTWHVARLGSAWPEKCLVFTHPVGRPEGSLE